MAGYDTCKVHIQEPASVLPASPRPTKAAVIAQKNARQNFRKRMAARGFEQMADAITEHERLMQEAVWFREVLRETVFDLQENGHLRYDHAHGEQLRAEVALYERAILSCDKIITSYVRLGIAERRVKIDEAQAVMLVSVIKAVLDDLDLTKAQQAKAATAVPLRLRALEPGKD